MVHGQRGGGGGSSSGQEAKEHGFKVGSQRCCLFSVHVQLFFFLFFFFFCLFVYEGCVHVCCVGVCVRTDDGEKVRVRKSLRLGAVASYNGAEGLFFLEVAKIKVLCCLWFASLSVVASLVAVFLCTCPLCSSVLLAACCVCRCVCGGGGSLVRMKKDAGAAARRGAHRIDAFLRCCRVDAARSLHVMLSDRLWKSELVSTQVVMTEIARGPFSHGPTSFDRPHLL